MLNTTFKAISTLFLLWILIPISVTASGNDKEPTTMIIAAVGDSLTAGYGVSIEQAYPALLEKRLKYLGYDVKVINAGISGETSSGTLSRLPWILRSKPQIVILETGANDGFRGIPTEILRKNIGESIQLLQKEGVTVVLAGMQMVWNMGEDYTESFNSIYPDIAQETNVIFMDFFLRDVATVQELNQFDGIHPLAQGYEIIADNILPHALEAINLHNSTKQPTE